MLMMVMAATSFVSCMTDDEYEAYTLEGAWEGNMGVYYGDYRSVKSVIYFDRDPYRYSSGIGYQTDYFNNSSWYDGYGRNYVANHIEWEVWNGVIRIYYVEDDVYAEIRDYRLSDGYFDGYIDYEDGTSSHFHMIKTYSPNDWNGYYDWGFDYYYYAKPANGDFETRAAASGNKVEKPTRSAKPSVMAE